jgi:hypothetical protein
MAMSDLASVINALPQLERLAVRGNPMMVPYADARTHLVSRLSRLVREGDTLAVVDTSITVDDRVRALQASGASQVRCRGRRV